MNLIRANKAVSDKDFIQYINKKKDDYDNCKDISVNQLMVLVAKKFKTKKQDGGGGGGGGYAPSGEQKQIWAQIEKLKQSMAKRGELQAKTRKGFPNTVTKL